MKNKCKIEKKLQRWVLQLIESQSITPAKQYNTLAFNLLRHIPTLCGWSMPFCVF